MSIWDGTVSPTVIPNVCVIGSHSEINGEDAQPSGFVVARHELEQVARYWIWERFLNDFFCFISEMSGSYEWRLSLYSAERLTRLP